MGAPPPNPEAIDGMAGLAKPAGVVAAGEAGAVGVPSAAA
jgi:hypothetical protein